jgi:hypothetical protein
MIVLVSRVCLWFGKSHIGRTVFYPDFVRLAERLKIQSSKQEWRLPLRRRRSSQSRRLKTNKLTGKINQLRLTRRETDPDIFLPDVPVDDLVGDGCSYTAVPAFGGLKILHM